MKIGVALLFAPQPIDPAVVAQRRQPWGVMPCGWGNIPSSRPAAGTTTPSTYFSRRHGATGVPAHGGLRQWLDAHP
jgi:hypothetical protein